MTPDAASGTIAESLVAVREAERSGRLQALPQVRAAFLSDFTLRPLEACLRAAGVGAGLAIETLFDDFSQHVQLALDPASVLHRFDPDVAFLSFSPPDADGDPGSTLDRIKTAVDAILIRSRATVVVNNFVAPSEGLVGFVRTPGLADRRAAAREMNLALDRALAGRTRVCLFDLDAFASHFGKHRLVEPRERFLWQMRVGTAALPALASEYVRVIRATRRPRAKCLVLDLDDTLWGGVVGEVGADGIQLGSEPPGNAFVHFQRTILEYHRSGVILAIASKNDPADALEVLRSHPHVVLRPEHFAAMRIDWNDKADNLREIARELDIGVDTLVFVDDNPVERHAVRTRCPEVTCIELPDDPLQYCEALRRCDAFDTLHTSAEDAERGRSYAEDGLRREARKSFATVEEYLRSLAMRAVVGELAPADVARAAQMCSRTNQFNLTTQRYDAARIEGMLRDGRHLLYGLRLGDRFGDSGMVGLAVLRREARRDHVDAFLLSCRVIGRGAELAFLAEILSDLRGRGAVHVEGSFRPTAKNVLCRDFYRRAGFQLVEDRSEETRWAIDLSRSAPCAPPWIAVERGGGRAGLARGAAAGGAEGGSADAPGGRADADR